MLQRITIHNLALIRDLEIEFCSKLNVLSGETGAGKSIIVDSLMLLIGARYDKSMLKFGEDKGFVEGVFTCDDTVPAENLGIDVEDGVLIVTRKFFKDGRNDIRVNGKQITTSMLRELMSSYVDIHGQNEYQSLLKVTEQRKMLDYFVFSDDDTVLVKQKELYNEYKSTLSEMNKLGNEQERAQRIDILKYQIEEIESANVKSGEEELLLERRHVLMSAERIKTALAECYEAIDGEDGGAILAISNAMRSLSQISALGERYNETCERLRSVSIELDDVVECVKDELNAIDDGEKELDAVLTRLEKVRSIKNKYGNYDAMNKFLSNAKGELDRAENGAQLYEELSKRISRVASELFNNSEKLSKMRRDAAVIMQNRIMEELSDLGMANARFEIRFKQTPTIDELDKTVTANGFDDIEFYLSPNTGMPLMPLAKIISGGEMSRFMLSVKLVSGNGIGINTMIFDEIDTGISGAIGLSVAKKLCRLSRNKQVLCVTHLAQIAAMADSHFYISKYDDEKGTVTHVKSLDLDGQIGELSRLSGTQGISSSSDKNAAEMKAWANNFKTELNK